MCFCRSCYVVYDSALGFIKQVLGLKLLNNTKELCLKFLDDSFRKYLKKKLFIKQEEPYFTLFLKNLLQTYFSFFQVTYDDVKYICNHENYEIKLAAMESFNEKFENTEEMTQLFLSIILNEKNMEYLCEVGRY